MRGGNKFVTWPGVSNFLDEGPLRVWNNLGRASQQRRIIATHAHKAFTKHHFIGGPFDQNRADIKSPLHKSVVLYRVVSESQIICDEDIEKILIFGLKLLLHCTKAAKVAYKTWGIM